MSDSFEKLGHVIPNSKGAPILALALQYQTLLKQLQGGLPKALAKHCVACNVTGATLIIYSNSPGSSFQLRFHQPEIDAILKWMGYRGVSKIAIRTIVPVTLKDSRHNTTSVPSQEISRMIAESAEGFSDTLLGSSLRRLGETLDACRKKKGSSGIS